MKSLAQYIVSKSKKIGLFADAEGLQRAVEGRAASDEEEEDRGGSDEGQCCLMEVKKQISRLHSCGKGLADF